MYLCSHHDTTALELIQGLIDLGAEIQPAVECAFKAQNLEALDLLLTHKGQADSSLFIQAAQKYNRIDTLEVLFKHRESKEMLVDEKGNTLLHHCLKNENDIVAIYLLSNQ